MNLPVQYKETLRQNLKRLRESKSLTQQEFAEVFQSHTGINTSVEAVRKWENKNGSLPRTETLLALCAFYNCDLDFLIGRMEERRHDIRYIKELTGLSEEAISQLIKLNEGDLARTVSPASMVKILSFILSDDRLPDILESVVVASAFKSAPKDGIPQAIQQADQDTYYGRFYNATRHIENILEDSISV